MLHLPNIAKGFYRHYRSGAMVKVVGFASHKEAGMVVLYHPLNPYAPVYEAGKLFDWKRPDEFTESYQHIAAQARVAEYEKVYQQLYPEYAVYFT